MKTRHSAITSVIVSIILTTSGSTLYASPLTNIVGNWHIDEGRGQRILDSSGNGRHGQLGSTLSVDTADPTWTIRRFDTAALHFDGVNYVRIIHSRILEPKEISVEAWVNNLGTPGNDRYIVSKSSLGCQYSAYALYTGENGGVAFYVSDGNTYYESVNVDTSIWDGNWHHLVGSYDGSLVHLYVDGNEIGIGLPASKINYSSFLQKDLYIGDFDGQTTCGTEAPNSGNYHFVGDIDEVRIWDRALTATEVTTRYKGD